MIGRDLMFVGFVAITVTIVCFGWIVYDIYNEMIFQDK